MIIAPSVCSQMFVLISNEPPVCVFLGAMVQGFVTALGHLATFLGKWLLSFWHILNSLAFLL